MLDAAIRATYRKAIAAKVQAAHDAKAVEKTKQTCAHDWQPFRETVRPDNSKFQGRAHFVVMGCVKCHEKRRTDYAVEHLRAGDAA